jgi:hypothetical protein
MTRPAKEATWAQQMILAEVDGAIRNRFGLDPQGFDDEEVEECWKERDRIAKLFGLPKRENRD